ncbi:hypothetical protein [Elizabethkingia anophelis]|uniref:hypothetical protein n=1 Tax=Elizabethkingia anophelis TaxID=1117645 RepID=UPI00320ACE3E
MKIIYETKNAVFITGLSQKKINEIKSLLGESETKDQLKIKAELRKFYSQNIKDKIKRGKI